MGQGRSNQGQVSQGSGILPWCVILTAVAVLVLSNYRAQQMMNLAYRSAVILNWVSFGIALLISPEIRKLLIKRDSLILVTSCMMLTVFAAVGWGDRAWLYTYISWKTIPLFYAGLLAAQRKVYQKCLLVGLIVSMAAVAAIDLTQMKVGGGSGVSREMMANVVAQSTVRGNNFDAAESQIQHMIYHFPSLSLTAILAMGLLVEAKGLLRYLLVGSVLLFATMVAVSTWTAAVLMLFAGFLLFTFMIVFRGRVSVRARLLISGCVLVALGAIAGYIAGETGKSRFETGLMADRLTGLTRLLSARVGISERLDELTGGRVARFKTSIDSFLDSPFIGIGNDTYDPKVGGHSFWVDMLAQYGLVGVAPMFYWLWIVLRSAMLLIWNLRSDPTDRAFATVVFVYYLSLIGNPYFFVTMPISVFFLTAGIVSGRAETMMLKLKYIQGAYRQKVFSDQHARHANMRRFDIKNDGE